MGRRSLLPLIACFVALATAREAAAAPTPIRVAIYTHDGNQAGAPRTLKHVLVDPDSFACRFITPEAIRRGDLRQFDVLIMPGGSASKQATRLGAQGREAIRQFVDQGGGYVGICAGSYLATPSYPWSLGLLNARVVDRQHWARGTGPVWLDLSPAGRRALDDHASRVRVYYGQGPLLAPGDYPSLPPYEALARYGSAIAKHGARPSTMIGTTAIARSTFGRGRVICFSPHPEKSGGPNQFIRAGVRWAAQSNSAVAESKSAPDRADRALQGVGPAGLRLARVLDRMDVEQRWLPGIHVNWRTGEPTQPRRRAATHCSAFAAAACDRLGVYILRPPTHSQNLLANAQQRWLLSRGRTEGWHAVQTWEEAQRQANQGEVVVASYRNTNPHKPGHIALVRPSAKSAAALAAEGPDMIWAGRHNRTCGSLFECFGHHPTDQILFFAHAAGK